MEALTGSCKDILGPLLANGGCLKDLIEGPGSGGSSTLIGLPESHDDSDLTQEMLDCLNDLKERFDAARDLLKDGKKDGVLDILKGLSNCTMCCWAWLVVCQGIAVQGYCVEDLKGDEQQNWGGREFGCILPV